MANAVMMIDKIRTEWVEKHDMILQAESEEGIGLLSERSCLDG